MLFWLNYLVFCWYFRKQKRRTMSTLPACFICVGLKQRVRIIKGPYFWTSFWTSCHFQQKKQGQLCPENGVLFNNKGSDTNFIMSWICMFSTRQKINWLRTYLQNNLMPKIIHLWLKKINDPRGSHSFEGSTKENIKKLMEEEARH